MMGLRQELNLHGEEGIDDGVEAGVELTWRGRHR